MKSLALTIAALFCFFIGFAQQYIPMPAGEAVWNYSHRSYPSAAGFIFYERFLLIQTGSDTTINNTVYKKIMKRSWDSSVGYNVTYSMPTVSLVAKSSDIFFAGLREDSQKVYIYLRTDTGFHEKLLYNFNANIGDTVPHISFLYAADSALVITGIDSVQIGVVFHKRFHATQIESAVSLGDSLDIIEGIGTNLGLISYLPVKFSRDDYLFYCFSNGVTNYDALSPCSYMWPYGTPTSVPTAPKSEDLNVYPNPFHEVINISAANYKRAILYNATGAVIMDRIMEGHKRLATADLPTGFYFLKLFDKDGAVIATRKLVKE